MRMRPNKTETGAHPCNMVVRRFEVMTSRDELFDSPSHLFFFFSPFSLIFLLLFLQEAQKLQEYGIIFNKVSKVSLP